MTLQRVKRRAGLTHERPDELGILSAIGPLDAGMRVDARRPAEPFCEPAVFSVTLNVPVPDVSVEFAGSVAFPSLELKCTVPA